MTLRDDLLALADRLDQMAGNINRHPEWSHGVRKSAQAGTLALALSAREFADAIERAHRALKEDGA